MNTMLATAAQRRVLSAAVDSFGRCGYNGVSTREIARAADVNEVTIYRNFPTKKDLFMAALESELESLRFRADLLGQMAAASDFDTAVLTLVELISDAVAQQPQLVRLLHFSILEFGPDLHVLFSKYMREVLDAVSFSMCRFIDLEHRNDLDERAIVLAIVSSILSLEVFYPVVWQAQPLSNGRVISTCRLLWSSVLLRPASSHPSAEPESTESSTAL